MPQRIRTWDGQTWMLDPGALFLDFVYTGDFGVGSWREGIVSTGAELDAWLADHLGRRMKPLTRTELASARDLRDCLARVVKAAVDTGEGPDVGDLALIAETASRPDLAPVLPGHEPEEDPDASQALATLARDALVHLRDYPGRLRVCGGHECPIVFLDVSRAGRRTWCSMARCGNRAKVRAHRSRTSGKEGTKE